MCNKAHVTEKFFRNENVISLKCGVLRNRNGGTSIKANYWPENQSQSELKGEISVEAYV